MTRLKKKSWLNLVVMMHSWLSAAWAIWLINKEKKLFYLYLTLFLVGRGAWLETWDRNEEGNDTLSHVTLWTHETFSVKYNCKQDGCGFQILAFAGVVGLNCDCFGWRGAKSWKRSVCSPVAFSGSPSVAHSVWLRWSQDRSLISMTLGVCSPLCVRLCVFVHGHMCAHRMGVCVGVHMFVWTCECFRYGWYATDALVVGDKAVAGELARVRIKNKSNVPHRWKWAFELLFDSCEADWKIKHQKDWPWSITIGIFTMTHSSWNWNLSWFSVSC